MRGALLVLLLAAGCAGRQPVQIPAEDPPSLAAVTIPCASGEEVSLRPDGQVRVVELWATWCAPCVRSLPAWDELAATGVEVLAVSIDDDRELALDFARSRGLTLPVLWDPFAQRIARAVPQLDGVVPTTMVIGCDGNVRHVHQGFDGPAVVEEVARQVEALRAEPACAAPAQVDRCR